MNTQQALAVRQIKSTAIRKLNDAPFLFVPITSWRGHEARVCVKIGERVLKYQKIAEAQDDFAANVHSPISAKVIGIKDFIDAQGNKLSSLILENDFENQAINLPSVNTDALSREEILRRIEQAGIVGAGGAQFATAQKYRLAGQNIKTFIINGVECEPFICADFAVMNEHTQALFEGIRLINKVLNAEKIILAIEQDNKILLNTLLPYLSQAPYANIQVKLMQGPYPQGSQWQLIKSVSNVQLSTPDELIDHGFVVSNVSTVYAIYQALKHEIPFVSRIVTVYGNTLTDCGNYDISIGTPCGFVLQQLGMAHLSSTVITGGPMMGRALSQWSYPLTKGTNALLILPEQDPIPHNCIGCGQCVDACPMHLMPLKFAKANKTHNKDMFERHQVNMCISCGACESICPSHVPLMASIAQGKILTRKESKKS